LGRRLRDTAGKGGALNTAPRHGSINRAVAFGGYRLEDASEEAVLFSFGYGACALRPWLGSSRKNLAALAQVDDTVVPKGDVLLLYLLN
jgi:hypothetical protein